MQRVADLVGDAAERQVRCSTNAPGEDEESFSFSLIEVEGDGESRRRDYNLGPSDFDADFGRVHRKVVRWIGQRGR